MASGGGPAADQNADLMKNLTLESQNRTDDSAEAAKKPTSDQNGSANGGAQNGNGSVPSREQSMTPLLHEINQVTDMSMCYLPTGYPSAGYIYGGYDGSIGGWEDYSRYISPDGVEVTPAVYGDMYHHGYGYASYSSYAGPGSTVPTMGHDAQLYGQHHYQYPASYYQGPAPASASYMPNQTPTARGEVSTSTGANQPSVSVDTSSPTANATVQGNANGSSVSVPLKPNYQNASVVTDGAYGRGSMPGRSPTGYQDPRYGFDGMRSPVPWFDGNLFPAGQQRSATPRSQSSSTSRNVSTPSARSQSQRPLPHVTGLQAPRPTPGMGSASPSFLNKMYPNNRLYGQLGNTFRAGFGYGPNSSDSRIGGNWSVVTDSSYKTRGRGSGFYGNGNENQDGFSELNRGPRSGNIKNQKPVVENVKEESSGAIPNMEQYNREDFPDNYSDAKFFIIKSYSEDDIHRSVKYSVWASTPNGNTKLDNAYKEAQKKAGGCPVFLFFSVNTSGQFVGAAEMVGPVDFEKTLEYWQQDKWFGCFPVKWHIVKDVPNPILKHITLENNDNKPVTNSRDTQEVKLEQGFQMLKLFKEHVSKTSILDDFDFYEKREKMMQERKAKQKQIQKQGLDGKTNSTLVGEQVVGADAMPNPHKASVLIKESFHSEHEERKVSEGTTSGVGAVADDAQKVAEPATEHTAEKGVASG